jgi:hypothetical protein
MNVSEFLKERESCPICDYQCLVTYFQAIASISVRREEDSLVAIKNLNPLVKGKDPHYYKAGYYFSLIDNSFAIEFFTKKGERFVDQTHLHLIEKFKSFSENIHNKYYFTRECPSCRNYLCTTKDFSLDFKACTLDIELGTEIFGFVTKTNEDYKTVVLSNNYRMNSSKIFYWRGDREETVYHLRYPSAKVTNFTLPLIPFVSREKTNNRINTLLLFS